MQAAMSYIAHVQPSAPCTVLHLLLLVSLQCQLSSTLLWVYSCACPAFCCPAVRTLVDMEGSYLSANFFREIVAAESFSYDPSRPKPQFVTLTGERDRQWAVQLLLQPSCL
jgi:hypothetical protein